MIHTSKILNYFLKNIFLFNNIDFYKRFFEGLCKLKIILYYYKYVRFNYF